MHQYVDKRLTRSNYIVKDITSDIHGEKLLKGIHHINSYNLSNWFNKFLCIYKATAHAWNGIGCRSLKLSLLSHPLRKKSSLLYCPFGDAVSIVKTINDCWIHGPLGIYCFGEMFDPHLLRLSWNFSGNINLRKFTAQEISLAGQGVEKPCTRQKTDDGGITQMIF